jgi:hypothetical protein
MKRILFLLLIPFLFSGCSDAQTAGNKKDKEKAPVVTENTPKPKVDIKVNKVFDENGNLVKYDSTYVWSYSNIKGDSVTVNADSVLSEFRPFINDRFPDFKTPDFNDFMFSDSSFYRNFFSPDYFYDRWQQSLKESERMFREMDSLKNLFFQQNYPGLQKPEKEK